MDALIAWLTAQREDARARRDYTNPETSRVAWSYWDGQFIAYTSALQHANYERG